MEDTFIIIPFPEVQLLQDIEGFEDNSLLINDGKLYEEYGDSAYMVRTSWLKINNQRQKVYEVLSEEYIKLKELELESLQKIINRCVFNNIPLMKGTMERWKELSYHIKDLKAES